MLSKLSKLLHKDKSLKKADISINTSIAEGGWHAPLSAKELLDTPLRQRYLSMIWQNISMTPEMFNRLYRTPIERYAELVQLLPASESHHHAHLGGMLDHGLEVISIAIRLRQNYVLPQNSSPEEQAKQKDVWSAVVIYAALLHDLGKIFVDIEVHLKSGNRWYPWLGKPNEPYKFRYIQDRDYSLHPTLGAFLSHYLLPQEALDWLMSFKQASSSLFYLLSGHNDKAGLLAEIIQRADQMSVTMALGGDINKLSETPKISFAKQLQIALIHVINNFKLNATQGGGNGWLTDDGLWVMSKTTADNIRAYLISQGISVPSQNGKLFDELQAHNLIEKNAQGEAIWHAKVTSQTGWTHDKPFTVLKISPTVIWENIESRPAIFNGRVELTDEKNNLLSGDTPLQVSNSENVDENIKNVADGGLSLSETDINDLTTVSVSQNNSEALSETNLALSEQKAQSSTKTIEGNIGYEENTDDELDSYLELFPVKTDVLTEEEHEVTATTQTTQCEEIEKTKEVIDYPSDSEPIKSLDTDTNNAINTDVVNADKFLQWLKSSIQAGTLIYNRPNAKLHIIQNHAFLVSPGIFQLYLSEAGITDKASWELLQKQFQSLGIHKRQRLKNDRKNIWKCKVAGPKKTSKLNGYLVDNPEQLFGSKLIINNQWLTLEGEI